MLENKLKEIFGYPSFRNGQREVIEGLLTGQSMAAIFPTGAGKSMCYQLPATQLPHLTIVISPLLALIQDQLEFLRSHNIAACGIDSTRTYQEILTDQQEIRNGKIKLLFVSVERFNNERFRNFLKEIPISLMVIDEAHCISEWGHNFRPDYLKLPKIREKYQIPQVLLLTATATPKVAKDMSTRFDIKEQNIIQTGFYRPNLDISIRPLDSQQRISYIKKVLDDHLNEATIIYVTLQKTANFLSNVLKEEGFSCEAYHAGLKMEERDAIQCRFMSGETPTIIATIAFGMGIDKSNIRNVIHYDLPKSIENYSQEIGRAGRDGEKSRCICLGNENDLGVLKNFIYGSTPDYQAIQLLIELMSNQGNEWHIQLIRLANETDIRSLTLKTILVYLEMMNYIKPSRSYYASYKFKFLDDQNFILQKFSGERQSFLASIFNEAKKAKFWYTLDLDHFISMHGGDRDRVIQALNYLETQNHLETQVSNLVEVYTLTNRITSVEDLSSELKARFHNKELDEIKRIDQMVQIFETKQCLHQQLSEYFGDLTAIDQCGHCSVCKGHVVSFKSSKDTSIKLNKETFNELEDFAEKYVEKFRQRPSLRLQAKFLCGITSPHLTVLRARSMNGYATLEQFNFNQILQALESTTNESLLPF